MDTHQGHLFSDSAESRACVSCGRDFVPDQDYHEYCDRCFRRRQKRKPKSGESSAEWMERYYAGK